MSERDIPSLLQDILEAIGNIKDFAADLTFDAYKSDLKTKHAENAISPLLAKPLPGSTNLFVTLTPQ
jgi:hypothetical protein